MTINPDSWKIEHQCPQCGAPVLLDETDRVLTCPFCRTRLYLATPDHFRFHIPPPERGEKDMLYVPYWRLKGASYAVKANEIRPRFVDTSLLAATNGMSLPSSLGVKPQAMTLKFVSPETKGRFLAPALSPDKVIPGIEVSENVAPVFHRAFIGEAISMVYAPTFIENNLLFDALLARPIGVWTEPPGMSADIFKPQDWRIRFIPTLCPKCGWDLEGDRDVMILICRHCDSAWRCSGDAFTEIPFTVLSASGRQAMIYLPFWRIKAHTKGIALDSYADLIRLANLPKAMQPDFASMPFHFWSPAFKVNPSLFLRWSRQMTIFQPAGETTQSFSGASLYPVTLSNLEALENIKITLAQIVVDKRGVYPLLEEIMLVAEETLLVYHPFIIGLRELMHETMRLTIDRTALNYGAYL